MFISTSLMGKLIVLVGSLLISGIVALFNYTKSNRFLLASICCLGFALFTACSDYYYTEKVLWIYDKTTKTNISPALISTLLGFFVVIPVFIRCKADIINNPNLIKVILLVLDSLVAATFLNCFLTNENIISGLPVNGYTFLGVGIILSWLGIKAIAGYVWIILIVLSLFKVVQVDQAMGMWGAIYICSCIIGIILQLKYICGDINELRALFSQDFENKTKVINNDIHDSTSIYR